MLEKHSSDIQEKGRGYKIKSCQRSFPIPMKKEVYSNKAYFRSAVLCNVASAVNTEESIVYNRGNWTAIKIIDVIFLNDLPLRLFNIVIFGYNIFVLL